MLYKIMSHLASLFLKASAWKVQGELPRLKKFIIILAPHTSNWDFFLLLALGLKWRVMAHTAWFGKHTIFVSWIGSILRALGGIPVDRSRGHDLVERTVEKLASCEDLMLVLAPEGTRKWTDHWKRGFYVIAERTHLPVVLAFINYEDKILGIGPTLTMGGQLEEDWKGIRDFYQARWAKYPACFSSMRFRDESGSDLDEQGPKPRIN